jgi:hypothetical protein
MSAIVESRRQICYRDPWRRMPPHSKRSRALAEYLWWEPVGGQPHSEDRIIAQTMNLGTYHDILVLEQTVGKPRLVEIMLRAAPGWISDRPWEFWRGRLSYATGAAIPDKAPRRSFV